MFSLRKVCVGPGIGANELKFCYTDLSNVILVPYNQKSKTTVV